MSAWNPDSSLLLAGGFGLLSLAAIAFWAWASAYAAPSPGKARQYRWVSAGVLSCWALLAAIGTHFEKFREFEGFPPLALRLFLLGFVATVALGLSPPGRRLACRLPLTLLVGFQAFRIPVELLLHRAHEEGLAPIQMTYLGRNFDVVAGSTALVLGLWLGRRPVAGWLVGIWNFVSLGLLLNIVGIAILSMPTSFRVFQNEPANIFVAQMPFVWLPTLLVTSALLGHILVFRRLLAPLAEDQRSP